MIVADARTSDVDEARYLIEMLLTRSAILMQNGILARDSVQSVYAVRFHHIVCRVLISLGVPCKVSRVRVA